VTRPPTSLLHDIARPRPLFDTAGVEAWRLDREDRVYTPVHPAFVITPALPYDRPIWTDGGDRRGQRLRQDHVAPDLRRTGARGSRVVLPSMCAGVQHSCTNVQRPRSARRQDSGYAHAELGRVMMSLVPCPDPGCRAVAEISDRITVGSTHGPIEHVRTLCLDGHHFLLPASRAFWPPSPAPRHQPDHSETRQRG
jgi:hypothetical protein